MSPLVSRVKKLLESLYGYKVTDTADHNLIEFAIEERTDFVKAYCNRSDIPELLEKQIVKMACGQFLYQKYLMGGIDALGATTLPLITSTTIDDTSVSYSSGGSSVNPDVLIVNHLKSLRRGNLATLQEFRRLKFVRSR